MKIIKNGAAARKDKYQKLSVLFADHIFLVGNEAVSPLRLNPLEV
ncbi:MAG: hypothetical protein ACUVXA_00215 [Candidatus Jordarchaeum sp.]